MRIRSVRHNNRKKVFEVGTSTETLVFPFSKAAPGPTTEDPITELSVDAEAGREAFTYVLHSGGVAGNDNPRAGFINGVDAGWVPRNLLFGFRLVF